MIQRYAQFGIFRKGSGNSLSTTFCVWFLKKNVSHIIFCQVTKFHCVIVFTSVGIGQYIHCNCLLTKLWRQKFEIKLIVLIKPFFYPTESQNKNLNILITNSAFKVKQKTFFIIFYHFSFLIILPLHPQIYSFEWCYQRCFTSYFYQKYTFENIGWWKLPLTASVNAICQE